MSTLLALNLTMSSNYFLQLKTLGTLHRSFGFAVSNADAMAINNGPYPESNLSQTLRFPALERKEGLGTMI